MKIREINEFESTRIVNSAEAIPKITIKNSKLKGSIEVIGSVLEAQFAADDCFLLFVTEGNPLEEALYVYFLDGDLKIQDALELSADYASGIFNNCNIVNDNSIKFSFFSKEDCWILTVFDSPRVSFFDNKYPVKRRSPFFSKRWLRLARA